MHISSVFPYCPRYLACRETSIYLSKTFIHWQTAVATVSLLSKILRVFCQNNHIIRDAVLRDSPGDSCTHSGS